ncbi:MAG: phosphoenolpyruvate--protein phosphotransferase [Moraxella sp.]|nr:phosphoenolpyruvate--protein phosphotransferase [Moraxella sp.]
MNYINQQAVRMGAVAHDKSEALQVVGMALHELGLTQMDYINGLAERESQATTYLGQGIAIPHGTPVYKDSIQKTGVALVHFADGVAWGDDDEVVYLAVGIAAKSDEHLQVLRALTQVLGDDGVMDRLKQAKTADDIVAILTNQAPTSTSTQSSQTKSLLLSKKLISVNQQGDIEQLLFAGSELLKQAGAVEIGFLGGLHTQKLTQLTKGVYCISGSHAVRTSAVALIAGSTVYQGEPVRLLAVIAHNEQVDEERLGRLLDALMQYTPTSNISKQTLADALDINAYKGWELGEAILANRHGLHARPATQLSTIAKTFDGQVLIATDGSEAVSAKSLTKLLSLGVGYGQQLQIIVEPIAGAADVMNAIMAAINAGLGETVTPIKKSTATEDETVDTPAVHTPLIVGKKMQGIGASKGLCVGRAVVVQEQSFSYPATADDPSAERATLHAAVDKVKADLAQTIGNARSEAIAQIFTAHMMMLDDPELLMGVDGGIAEGLSAPMAWHSYIEKTAIAQEALDNPLLAQRAADLRDVGQRVLGALCGTAMADLPSEPYVLIKDDLLPSDVAELNSEQVAGIITAFGGASSHSAIVARSLGIPAIVGASASVLEIPQRATVLLNASKGWFVVSPDDELIKKSVTEKAAYEVKLAKAKEQAMNPAITQDGHAVEVAVNLGDVGLAANAVAAGAEGVGLLRTELVFMKHAKSPDVQAQVADYEQVFDALDGKPLVVRTLDIGGDKPLPYLTMIPDENPFLGMRGIRLTLQKPKLLRDQLTALLIASKGRPLRIMFPMVGRIEEWRAAREILDEILIQYPHPDLQVGIMIEVPSAAVMADVLAKQVDFFSIGTNDLTQYVLAIDRGHPVLSHQADGLHPSVLRLIDMAIKAAHKHGKWVGVCGELGADSAAVPILLGLGVDELSVSVASIAMLKAQIRTLNLSDCQALATKAMNCDTAMAVRELAGEG